MRSPCPFADREQLDFFGSPSMLASGSSRSSEPEAPTDQEEPADDPDSRTASSVREAQLSLGLPALPLNQFEWSDQQMCALRDGVLVAHLRLLGDERTTPALRADLIAWIAAPKRHEAELQYAPLSFQACCLSAGVDFEEMRERTLYLFAPELIDQLD